MADFTGVEERAFILSPTTGIGGFAGGRLYKTQVPDDVVLPRLSDGKVKAYMVARFQTPYSAGGGAVADGEEDIPHTMIFMVACYGGDADTAETLNAAVTRKLVGQTPSATATPIKAVTGFSFTQADSENYPTRYAEGTWFRCAINLARA